MALADSGNCQKCHNKCHKQLLQVVANQPTTPKTKLFLTAPLYGRRYLFAGQKYTAQPQNLAELGFGLLVIVRRIGRTSDCC